MDPCPVCGSNFPINELAEHVQLHFLDDEQATAGAGQAAPSGSFGGIVIDSDEELEAAEKICCPLGCGAMVLIEDLDSHEEAHRYTTSSNPQQLNMLAAFCSMQIAFCQLDSVASVVLFTASHSGMLAWLQAARTGVSAQEPPAGAGGGRV
jgi:hypothetical protein